MKEQLETLNFLKTYQTRYFHTRSTVSAYEKFTETILLQELLNFGQLL